MCRRQCDGVLAPLTQTFECEKHLCTPKHSKGMNIGKTSCPTTTFMCVACTEGKQYAVELDNHAERQTTKSLDIVHSGVFGTINNMSMGNAKYFVTFIDDI